MKKALFYLVLATTISSGTMVFAQSNYYGVSGNMVAGDFDNDGLIDDIAAFNTSGELPVLMLWTADNGWVDEKEASCRLPFDFIGPKALNSKIVAGDFDNDGYLDDLASIYEIDTNRTAITVWLNQNGKFLPSRWWYSGDFDANQVAQTIVAGDFDHDGFVDDIAAFYDYSQAQTKVFVWNGNRKEFSWPGTWWVGSDFNSTRIQGTMITGDFDHNGFQDDIAALYNYDDDYCKIFVWTTNGNKFNWPYTWFAKENFAAGNAKNNVIAGDFNNNGYIDNIAALYTCDEETSKILVFERNSKAFANPQVWWYGNQEASQSKMRLVSVDMNNNTKSDQITGLLINNNEATLTTWTAYNHKFSLPESSWQGTVTGIDNSGQKGGCLSKALAESFKLYPNPNHGQFTIDIPVTNDGQVEASIFNVLGNKVYSFNTNSGISAPVNLTGLKPGNYTVQITGSNFTLNKKFIVQ